MKKIIVIILLCVVVTKIQSQNLVYIPDPAFISYINYIVPGAMQGNYLDTLYPALQNVQNIEVGYMGIYDLTGVQYFHNVWYIECSHNSLTFLPPLPQSLIFFICSYNNLYSLPTLPNSLDDFRCNNNNLNSLPLLPASLTFLYCSSNNLDTLPALPQNLGLLDCSYNQLTNLPELPSHLYQLDCSVNQIHCLPILPNELHYLYGTNSGYQCLPNLPDSLDWWNIQGPSTVCMQNQASVAASGSTVFCNGGSVTLNANNGTGLTYQWKKNGMAISGATSSGYVANTTGSYTVIETSLLGCTGNPSVPLEVTVNPLPSATVTPSGPTTFCPGGSVVLNAPVAANRSYQWKKGANLISGATQSSYTATTGGNYKVIVTNTVTGCSKTTTNATTVTVNALPAATITPQGPTTFCAGGSVVLAANTGTGLTYKWKKGGNYVSGATLSNYTATLGGNYKVEVTKANGCSKTSAGVVVTVPCKDGEIISQENIPIAIGIDFNVFPNPNPGEFTIKFSNKTVSSIQIELTDGIGKVVRRFETNDETVVIKEPNLVKGIYFLSVRNKDGMQVKKINIV